MQTLKKQRGKAKTIFETGFATHVCLCTDTWSLLGFLSLFYYLKNTYLSGKPNKKYQDKAKILGGKRSQGTCAVETAVQTVKKRTQLCTSEIHSWGSGKSIPTSALINHPSPFRSFCFLLC